MVDVVVLLSGRGWRGRSGGVPVLVIQTVDTHLIEILDHHLVNDAVVPDKRLSVSGHVVALRTFVDETFLIRNAITHPVLEMCITKMTK